MQFQRNQGKESVLSLRVPEFAQYSSGVMEMLSKDNATHNANDVDNAADLSKPLEKLLACNRDMLKNAEAGEWGKVIEADVLRQTLFRTLYSSSAIATVPGISQATSEMLLINRQIEQLAVSAQKVAANDAVSINKGRKAVSAYAKHSIK